MSRARIVYLPSRRRGYAAIVSQALRQYARHTAADGGVSLAEALRLMSLESPEVARDTGLPLGTVDAWLGDVEVRE